MYSEHDRVIVDNMYEFLFSKKKKGDPRLQEAPRNGHTLVSTRFTFRPKWTMKSYGYALLSAITEERRANRRSER